MQIDVFTSSGAKKGTMELPSIFDGIVNRGLIHQMVVLQQANRRKPIAHVKTRGEVQGSTRKLYAQKGTGRARRGGVRSPLLRGGGKTFGPRNNRNFTISMPRKQRRVALLSCLALQAKEGRIFGLEKYEGEAKTKVFTVLLKKLPVDIGRRILIVVSGDSENLERSARNIPGVTLCPVAQINPVDVLTARHIIFLVDSLQAAQEVWGSAVRTKKKLSPHSA